MNSSLAATIDSLVWTPAGRFHMWSGASQSWERFRLLKYRGLSANVHVARSHVLIFDSQEGEKIGGGGGGGSGLDYVILLSEGGGGWVLITVDYGGGGGGKNAKKLIT